MYIGRGSKWGNPFVISNFANREEVIRKYEEWIMTKPELLKALPELKDKVIACWCAPKACHGDVLKKLAEKCYQ